MSANNNANNNNNTGLEKYEKICDIGKGSFGTVSKIRRKADGRTLVWKELNYGKMSEKEK
jgi:serine/threonine protein kinase